MALTAPEKAAARAFLARLGQDLAAAGPAAPCSPYIREYRHSCPARGGASVCLRLREEYRDSPARPGAAAGAFAAFWREGECPACGLAVRSTLSRLFLAAGRPPERSPSRG